jgi:MFS transporter, SP family, major inositol transporter
VRRRGPRSTPIARRWFLALFFPSLVDGIGITGAFFLFAAVGVIALLFVVTQVPETRGRSLESLEEDVESGAIFNIRKMSHVR